MPRLPQQTLQAAGLEQLGPSYLMYQPQGSSLLKAVICFTSR